VNAVRPEQILKILDITDSFNLHREAIFIPLQAQDDGSATILADGRLRIVCPERGEFQAWLNQLRSQLETMDLSKIQH
jgi:hypothetical protein